MKRLWFGEQDISQKRFKKFLKHAGHPTRNDEVTSSHGVKFYIEHRSRVKIVKETLDQLACKT
jgi:hypothetical protein